MAFISLLADDAGGLVLPYESRFCRSTTTLFLFLLNAVMSLPCRYLLARVFYTSRSIKHLSTAYCSRPIALHYTVLGASNDV